MTDGTLQGPLMGLTVRLSVDGSAAVEAVTDQEGCYRLRWESRPAGQAGIGAAGAVAAAVPGAAVPGAAVPGAAAFNGSPRRVRVEVLGPRDRLLARSAESLAFEAGEDLEIDLAVPSRHVPADPDGSEGSELRFLCGEPVDLAEAARLSVRGLRDAYRYLKHPHREARNIDLIRRAFPNTRSAWDAPPFALGECTDGWGDAMRRLLAERGAPMGEHDADDLPPGAPPRVFYGDRVLVRYTTDDAYPHDRVPSIVPVSDQEMILPGGLSIGWVRHRLAELNVKNSEVAPVYVQQVALLCDHFIGALTRAPFSLRDPRGTEPRLEVRILHQRPFAATTHPALDHVQLAPDNPDDVQRRALAYVLFLRSVYRYNDTARPRGLRDIVRHGGAAMASEMLGGPGADPGVDPGFALPMAASLLDDPDGPKKAARFGRRMWRYFARQHGVEPPAESLGTVGGFDFFRSLLEASADPDIAYEPEGLRAARSGLPFWGSFDRFVGQAGDASPGLARDLSWGNWLIANTLDGLGIRSGERRFQLPEVDRTTERPDRHSDVAVLGVNGDLRIGPGGRRKRHVAGLDPWSARVFRLRPRRGDRARVISIGFHGSEGPGGLLVQILRIGTDNALIEVHRFDGADLSKVVHFEGLDSLVVIVAGRDTGGAFTLVFEEHAEASDVMITPPNARAGTETCVDPAAWSWTWLSPDIMVDNDDDGRADGLLPFGADNKLKVRLRNRGNVRSGPVIVRFWYQRAAPTPAEDAWMPVLDTRGVRQELSGVRLEPDEFRWFAVNWAPADDGSGETGFLVRVEVLEPRRAGEPRPPANRDNKLATTTIKKVRPLNDPDFIDVTVRRVNAGQACGICSVPHGPEWTAEEESEGAPEPSLGLSTRRFRLTRRGQRVPFPGGAKELAPSSRHYYPVDPRSLPPGVTGSELITIAAHAEGQALSGMTFAIGDEESRVIQPSGARRSDDSGPVTLLS